MTDTSTPHIVVCNVWHDDNRGDGAIAAATLTALAERWPGARFTVLSLLDEHHPAYSSAYRHLVDAGIDLTIAPHPLPHVDRAGTRREQLTKALRYLAALPASLLALLAPGRFARGSAALPVDADLVVVSGGHSLFSHRLSPPSWIGLHRGVLPMLLARRAGTPYVLFGHSLGPFDDALGRWLAAIALRGAQLVTVREELSEEVAAGLGVDDEALSLRPDVAFSLRPRATGRVADVLSDHDLTTGRFWAVTVRRWFTQGEATQRTEAFLGEMATVIRTALDEGATERVAVVAHTIGPVPNEDDRIPSRRLMELLDDPRVTLVVDDLSPPEMSAFYAHAELLLGTRLHSVILAAVERTPSLAVSYFGPKAIGVMRMLGLEHLCVDMGSFDAADVRSRLADIDVAALSVHLDGRVDELVAELHEAIAEVRLR